MANITPRRSKNGEITSFRIRVARGYDYHGKQLPPYSTEYKPPHGLSEKQALKEAQRFALEFEEQCLFSGNVNSSMKLKDFILEYLQTTENTLAPTTHRRAEQVIRDFINPSLGHLKIKDLKPHHIQQFVNQLAETPKLDRKGNPSGEMLSPSTVKRNLAILQAILKLAVKQGLISENPANVERLTLPKAQKPKIEIFTKQEAAEMIECLLQEDLQFQTLVQLAIFTGARRGELVALRFSDIDFTAQKITFERSAYKLTGEPIKFKPPKDYETRSVTINETCIELLKMLQAEKIETAQRLGSKWAGDNNGWVFTQWNGEIMNPDTPTEQFPKFLEKHGLKHRKFHSLRHTSATLLLYAGVNIKQVQTRLGHGSIETTNKYLHYIEEADVEAVKKLDILLLPKKDAAENDSTEHQGRMTKIS